MRMRSSFSHAVVSVASLVAAFGLLASSASAKGLDATRISLPKGPGSVEGLGKNFTASLSSGTAAYGVDIAVPPAAAGHAPKLSLDYDSGGGISDLGIGWQLGGLPEIRRRTENGLPKFDETDAFEITGFGAPSDLLEISSRTYRPQYESGSFVRVQRAADGKTWEARDKSGTTYRFGGEGFVEQEDGRVATWLLREQLDVYGHVIKYTWKTDGAHGRLERVTYNDFSPEARNEVLFQYESRPDAHTRFTSGIREEYRDRVAAVEVLHGGALVRRYDLTYSAGTHSQLATVTLVGSDGVTKLPTLSLGYTQVALAADGGGLVTMKSPPGRTPADGNVDIADLDGDGLPDLLVTKAGAYRTYLNHDGIAWRAPIDWTSSASPSLELSQVGVQLADLDGDGALDLVAKSGISYFRYLPGKDASSFGAAVSIATVPNFTFEDPDVRVADMDGDRRGDLVITTSAGLAIGFNKSGTDWTEPKTIGVVDGKQPLRFSVGKTQLCDVNGDRVQDLCYLRSESLVYWLGRGRGRFEPAKTATGVPSFDTTAPYQLVDLDGDGWVDLLRVGVSNVELALATGEGTFGSVKTITGTPVKGPTGLVKLADMNGSGTTDIVWIDVSGSAEGAWKYLELFPEGRGGLLKSIDNGLGKRVTMNYAPAARDAAAARDAGKPWPTRMNVGMPVVKSITMDSGLGDPVMRTEYVYRDGTFSAAERTFAGFAGGIERAIGDEHTPTLLTDSTFDVGLSDRTLRGMLLATESRDEKGYVFTRGTSSWTTRKLDAALDGRFVSYSFKSAEEVRHIEGTDLSKARVTLTEWEQDNLGNVTAEKQWGEVVAGDKLAGNDEAITRRTFANNTTDWILGRVASEELQDGKGARVRLRRLYYDGAAFEGLPLGQVARGNLSREEAWVGPGSDAFELVSSTRYDADSNPIETKDARGGGRVFEWDSLGRAFLTSEAVKTGSRLLVQQVTYDRALGQPLAFTNFNGAVSTFRYDALGRVVAIVKPGDSLERPTLRYSYELSAPLSRVTTEARKWSGHDDVERAFTLFDGLGRSRAEFAENGGDRWTVSGVGLLDARGNPRRSLQAWFAGAGAVSAAVLRQDGPGDDSYRDALGRRIRTRSQLGIESKTTYEPFVSKNWDGAQLDLKAPYEHTPIVHTNDGLGRRVSVGRSLEGSTLTNRFGYDAAGALVSRTDAENHVGRYRYDGRGRRVLVEDPDAGKHAFRFDATGNLIAHDHPDGKSVRYAHDLAGRVIAEDWNGDGTPEVFRTYDEGGDAFLGLLASVTDPSGSSSFTYDARQRVVATAVTIQGKQYSVGAAYDARDRKYLHRYPDGSSLRIQFGQRGLIEGYGNDAVRFAYDADGRELERRFNTGVVEGNRYDADRRRVEHKVLAADGAIVQQLEWVLDPVGNILELRDKRPGVDAAKDRSEVYTYDNAYRLRKAKGPWGETSWAYSASGNLTSRVSSDAAQHAGALSYGASAGPHALTTFKDRTIRYDARGRMLDDGERTYVWDHADHLAAVSTKSGASQESVYDATDTRRVRAEREASGVAHVTHFIDAWSEIRDGKLARFIVHGRQRIVRLSEKNGVPASGTTSSAAALSASEGGDEPPPPTGSKHASAPRVPVDAASYFVAMALFAAIGSRYRRQLARALPAAIPIVVLWLLAATSSVGCKGSGDEEPKPPIEDGTVLVLAEDDELLFADAIGSLTEATSGSGKGKASSATFAYGVTRYDSSPESRKFANTPRDGGVGLDQMGARSYAPELGVWTSVDPLAIDDPTALIGRFSSASYSYGGLNPVVRVDRDGNLDFTAPIIFFTEKAATAATTAALTVATVTVNVIIGGFAGGAVFSGDVKAKPYVPPPTPPNVSDGAMSPAPWALSSPVPAAPGSDDVSKGSTVTDNKAKGDAHADKVAENEAENNLDDVQRELTVKTKSGVRTRLDVVGKDKASGEIKGVEAKGSETAPLTKNQKKAFPEIEESGATVVGKGRPGYPPGTKIPAQGIKIVRPNDLPSSMNSDFTMKFYTPSASF